MQVSIAEQTQPASSVAAQTTPTKRDYHRILFFMNVVLVVVGYGLAHPTGFASVGPMKILRILVLGFSLFYLFNSKKHYQYIFKGSSSWILWVFITLNIYVLPFSANIFISFEKFINLVPYFIYINYFVIYLFRAYDKEYVITFILRCLNITYLIPVASFILFGGGFAQDDIYGEVVGGFVSNHYGWGCAIFLASSLDLLRNRVIVSKNKKILLIFLCLIATYILAISGSRSGYLTFALCFLIFVLKNSNTSFYIKIFSTIAATYFVFHLYTDNDSALNKRLAKTETQLEKGDARSAIYELGFNTMANHPENILTGFGFYTFREAMFELNSNVDPKVLRINLHNSYLELFFGSGLFVFTFFLLFFVGKSLWNFAVYHSSRYTFLPPILLIPFFENNFNPGQFLFFPWFAIMFYYIHYNERQIKIEEVITPMPPVRKHQFL
ncbi:O-antigen ligase family protein [Rhodocytophaga aerolata]